VEASGSFADLCSFTEWFAGSIRFRPQVQDKFLKVTGESISIASRHLFGKQLCRTGDETNTAAKLVTVAEPTAKKA
jgi:hypothetical protein